MALSMVAQAGFILAILLPAAGIVPLFPLLFLSGSIAPIESMPWWLQVGSEVSPMRHYIEIVSGLFLKGAGIVELWPHAAALAAIAAPLFLGSWLIFRRAW